MTPPQSSAALPPKSMEPEWSLVRCLTGLTGKYATACTEVRRQRTERVSVPAPGVPTERLPRNRDKNGNDQAASYWWYLTSRGAFICGTRRFFLSNEEISPSCTSVSPISSSPLST